MGRALLFVGSLAAAFLLTVMYLGQGSNFTAHFGQSGSAGETDSGSDSEEDETAECPLVVETEFTGQTRGFKKGRNSATSAVGLQWADAWCATANALRKGTTSLEKQCQQGSTGQRCVLSPSSVRCTSTGGCVQNPNAGYQNQVICTQKCMCAGECTP